MVVDIQRDVHFAVADDSRNDLRINTITAKCCRQRVPKVVPPTMRNTETLYDRPDISLECVPGFSGVMPVSEQNIHSLFGNRERKALTRSMRLSESGGRRSDDEFFKLSAFP